jgi:ABC-type multidrug transport system ATPase subunit
VIINQGKIVAQESINEMGAAGSTAKTELTVQRSSDQLVAALKRLPGVKNVEKGVSANRLIVESDPSEETMAEISKTVVTENVGLTRMSPVQLALEDYYLNLIGGRAS